MERKYNKTDVGVIVGRFMVPDLHEAHRDLIDSVKRDHNKVIIFLGVSPLLVTTNNPLDFESRVQMIHEDYPEIPVLYIKDNFSDETWSKRLDEQIGDVVTPAQTVTLYGSRDSFISRYSGKYPTQELIPKVMVSGRQIREEIKPTVRPNKDFRAGVIWAAMNKFTTCYATVDVAIMNENETQVLLCKKPWSEKLYFVGGFSDVNSDSYEADVKREVAEETGVEVSEPVYVGSCKIPDWRYKNEKDAIKTSFFVCRYIFGSPKADDDIVDVKWIPINEIESCIADAHKPVLELFNKYKKY